jgi:hypothetical protein
MESELLSSQLEILRERFPELLSRPLPPFSKEHLALVRGHTQTLSFRGVQLSSRHDPDAEAELQASRLTGVRSAVLYGTGLGDLPRVLLKRSDLEKLRVVIMNRALFVALLEHVDMRDWMLDPRVTLTLARDEAQVEGASFILPADLTLVEDEAWKLRDRLTVRLQENHVNSRFSEDNSEHQTRIRENHRFLAVDPSVSEHFGMAQGSSVCVVGAGPSLMDTVSILAALRARSAPDRLQVIAVDTALKTLRPAGIEPDFVVAMDPFLKPSHVQGEPGSNTKLVYFPLVPSTILETWPGPRFLALSKSPLYEKLRAPGRGYLWAGGSVIHPAVDLAVRMGASRVTLFGVDFAFVDGKTHAGWENGELGRDLLNAVHWVENGRGEKVRSSVNFASYLCALEDYIGAHPEVRFLNSSEKGARILGTQFIKKDTLEN